MPADGSVIIDIKGDARDFDKSIEEATETSEEFGEKSSEAVNTLAAALAAAGVVATFKEIAEAIKVCVQASIEFESAITGVFKTVDGTQEQLAAITEGIRDLSTELPATSTEIAAVAEAAGQLGIQTDNVMEFTKVMIDLGESTNLSADEAATAFARFANITGTAAENYSRLGSTVVGLGNNFATTESEIVAMATRLASAGTLAGLTEPEIFALAAAMSSVGIEAEAGGTAMTQTLSAIETAAVTGGEKLDTFASIANMSADEFKTAWRSDAVGVLQAFVGGLADLTSQGESATLVLDELGLSGVRQGNMIRSLSLASDELGRAVELSNEAWEENTALSQEASKRYATLESRLSMTKNALTNVEISIGDALTPALGKMADMGTEAFSWAADFIADNPWLVQALTATAVAAGVLVAGVTGLTVFSKITPLIAAFNTTLAANPAIAVAAAIAGLISLLAFLSSATEDATKAQKEFSKELENSKQAHEDLMTEIDGQNQNTIQLAKNLDALAQKEHKSAAEKELLAETVARLNKELPELNIAYDKQTDKVSGLGGATKVTTESIIAMAEAEARAREMEAKASRMVEIMTEKREATEKLALARQHLADLEAKYAAEEEEWKKSYNLKGAGDRMQSLEVEISSAKIAVDGYAASLGVLEAEYGVLYNEVDNYANSVGEATSAESSHLTILSDAREAISAITEEYRAAYEAIKESLDGQASLFDTLKVESSTSAETIIGNLESQLVYWAKYSENLEALLSRDIEGIEQLALYFSDGSVQSAQALAGLATASDEELGRLMESLGSVDEFKSGIAERFAEVETNASERIASVVESTSTKLMELEQSEEMKLAGLDTLQGYIDGLDAKSGYLYAKVSAIGAQTIAAFRASLDMHSPSRAFREGGQDSMDGYVLGVEDKQKAVRDAMREAGEMAINSFNGEEVQLAIRAAVTMPEDVSERLRDAVGRETARFSSQLAFMGNAAEEKRIANRQAISTQTAAALASAVLPTSGDAVFNINGIEFARAVLNDFRSVEDQSPKIVSVVG